MIYLRDILNILLRNQFIKIFNEDRELLFYGFVWSFDFTNMYMLSCPVVGLNKFFNIINVTICYD